MRRAPVFYMCTIVSDTTYNVTYLYKTKKNTRIFLLMYFYMVLLIFF